MKREMAAVLILLALLSLSLLNTWTTDKKITELTDDIEAAETLYEDGKTQEAAETLASSLQLWLKWDFHTGIMLRQEEVDDITSSYCSLLSMVQNEDALSPASYKLLKEQLRSISEMEKITFQNIF